jgi:hypothetical protein
MGEILHTAKDVHILMEKFGVTHKTVKYALQGKTRSELARKIRNHAITVLSCAKRESKPVKYL